MLNTALVTDSGQYACHSSVGSVATRVISPQIQMTYMVCGQPEPWEKYAKVDDIYLLGRYDVVCTRAQADVDRHWTSLERRGDAMRPFFRVAHVAAVNVGSGHSRGFRLFL